MAELTIPGDCAKCPGETDGVACPLRDECLRFVGKPGNPERQVWLTAAPNVAGECPEFWRVVPCR